MEQIRATDAERDEPLLAGMVPVGVMAALMWGTEFLDLILTGSLDRFGIAPRQVSGLDGILWAPFLHSGFGHLLANTIPFLLMGAAIALGGAIRFISVTAIVGVIAGAGTWLTGPERTIHIGASGLVFGFLTYLITRGIFAPKLSEKVGYILGGLVTLMIYGGILWGLLPRPGVSWQGHLFGAIGGVVAAWFLHAERDTDRAMPRLDP